jgi:8-oxo-dGTP pyrophosphatase MutT (NUDIX family)
MSETLAARLRALPYDRGGTWRGRPAAVLLAFSPPNRSAPSGDRRAQDGRAQDGPAEDGSAQSKPALDGGDSDDLQLVLVRRPDSMRHHAGQIGFPGGAVEDADVDAVAAALREAREEVGIEPAWVEVLGAAGRVPVAVSGFDVELVIGLWDGTGRLVPSPGEVDAILRPTLRQLADPANHGTLPLAELIGLERAATRQLPPEAFSPVFHVDGHIVWGFTAGVLSELLDALGLPGPPLPPTWPRARTAAGRFLPLTESALSRDGLNADQPRTRS